MNGMYQTQAWGFAFGSDEYTATYEHSLAPTATLAKLTLADYYEFDDKSYVDLGFVECTYLDKNGVKKTDKFIGIDYFQAVHSLGRNGLINVVWRMHLAHVGASFVADFFFWPSVH